jgi:arylformamidase
MLAYPENTPEKAKQQPIIDISVVLQPTIPTWPGSPGFQLSPINRLEAGDAANVSQIQTDVHVGTHVDAPWHFLQNGITVEQLSLETLVGQATVVSLPDVTAITPKELEALQLPSDTKRLLFQTKNSQLWSQGITEFQQDFVALTAEAAQWVADRGIELVGVDYLSVQRYHDSPRTHEILLEAGIIIVEGLNLSAVQPGTYHFVCLPLKLAGADGAPARAILMPELESNHV